jgi:hypothetical protein
MAPPQTPQVSLAELSRCDDRSWLPVEEQNVDHKAERKQMLTSQKKWTAPYGILVCCAVRITGRSMFPLINTLTQSGVTE